MRGKALRVCNKKNPAKELKSLSAFKSVMGLKQIIALFIILFFVVFSSWLGVEQLAGRVATSLLVVETIPKNCTFLLKEGWNMVGLSCHPVSPNPKRLVADSNNEIASIHKYDSSDPEDPWKVYKPGLPDWVEMDLKSVDRYNGYWIYSQHDTMVNFSGTLRIPTLILLDPGWQFVGYPQLESRNITNVLASIAGAYSIVYGYNETTSDWKVYSPQLNHSTFQWMKPHEAFWVNMIKSGELQIE